MFLAVPVVHHQISYLKMLTIIEANYDTFDTDHACLPKARGIKQSENTGVTSKLE